SRLQGARSRRSKTTVKSVPSCSVLLMFDARPARPDLSGRSRPGGSYLLYSDGRNEVTEGGCLTYTSSGGVGTSNACSSAVAGADDIDGAGDRISWNFLQFWP